MNRIKELEIELEACMAAADGLPEDLLQQWQEDVADYYAKRMEEE